MPALKTSGSSVPGPNYTLGTGISSNPKPGVPVFVWYGLDTGARHFDKFRYRFDTSTRHFVKFVLFITVPDTSVSSVLLKNIGPRHFCKLGTPTSLYAGYRYTPNHTPGGFRCGLDTGKSYMYLVCTVIWIHNMTTHKAFVCGSNKQQSAVHLPIWSVALE